MVPGAGATYNPQGEVVACRAEVGGGRSSGDGGDNTTLPERRASSRVGVERCTRLRGLPNRLATPPTFVVVVVVVVVVLGSGVNARGGAEWARSTARGKPDEGEPHVPVWEGGAGTGQDHRGIRGSPAGGCETPPRRPRREPPRRTPPPRQRPTSLWPGQSRGIGFAAMYAV
jgi:hypothetical protein